MTSTLCRRSQFICSFPLQTTTTTRLLFRRGFASNSQQYDITVIGGGPGGYVAAIKAAQLGLKTACVESRGTLGGTCLNVGCIPSKALLNASHYFHDAQHRFKNIGIDHAGVTVNLPQMMAYKSKAITGLTRGIEGLFKKNKVEYVKGFGKLTGKNTVEVTTADGSKQTLNTKNIIIATGSIPASLKGVVVDEKVVVTSTGALELKAVPKRMVVIGGGVIGLEMGSVWSRLGSQVTVIEYLDRIIPGTDSEIATAFKRVLEKQGLQFKMSTAVTKCTVNANGKGAKLQLASAKDPSKTEDFEADIVLLSTGRRPFTQGLGLEELGIKMTSNNLQIATDSHFRTNITNIYAIGDVITGPMLAHKAEEEGIAAVEIIAGKAGHVNYNAIPGVIYTWPEVATVGQSEDELKKYGKIKYRVSKFPFQANSRARTNDDAEGLIKVLTDAETDRILGVHILGPNAGELIGEAVLGIEYGASAEDIARTCHAHPTLSEALKEACMQKPIHF